MNKINRKRISIIKNRPGGILAYVLIILLATGILTTSILHLFNSNLKQAKHQQDALEAYYLAYSGAEMAYSALLTKKPDGQLKLSDLTAGNEFKELDIDYGNGKISISVKISENANFDNWIEIESTGTLNKNNQSFTRRLFFEPANPVNKIWEND